MGRFPGPGLCVAPWHALSCPRMRQLASRGAPAWGTAGGVPWDFEEGSSLLQAPWELRPGLPAPTVPSEAQLAPWGRVREARVWFPLSLYLEKKISLLCPFLLRRFDLRVRNCLKANWTRGPRANLYLGR